MKPLQIGITGGIGSGKSVVCKILSVIGIPVYNADTESKKLLETDHDIQLAVKALFGAAAYLPNGLPDRALIADLIFNDPSKLTSLNAILHPAVQQHYRSWVQHHSSSEIVAKEAAILFESGSNKEMDYVIAVVAPSELRMSRIKNRDGKNEEEIKKIMKQQLTREEVVRKSDFVIENDDQQLIVPRILQIIAKIKSSAGLKGE